MSSPQITLYHFPAACSMVTQCALEMAGLPYELKLVNLAKAEQLTPEYLAISPMGKVPYMVIDGRGMGENAALLIYIARLRPSSGIFPNSENAEHFAEAIGGVSFCSGTLHPIVRALLNPGRITTGETSGVRDMGMTLAKKSFTYAEKRLEKTGWWLETLSIVDIYLYWATEVAKKGGFDFSPYPQLQSLGERLKVLPAFVTLLEHEEKSKAALGV